MASNVSKVDADRQSDPAMPAWNFRDEVLRWLLHGIQSLPSGATCSLENAHLSSLWLQGDTDAETL
jgi:hypothetical protein